MKGIFTALIFFSQIAMAEDLRVEVKDFNFNYKNPFGEGSAAHFSLGSLQEKEEVKVAIEKIEDAFKIKVSGAEEGEFDFKSAPSFMTKAETMDVQGLNLSLKESATLSLVRGSFISPDDELDLQNFVLDCSRDKAQPDVMDQMISGCMQRMIVRASKFASSSMDGNNLTAALTASIVAAIEDEAGVIGGMRINSLNMNVAQGKFDLAAEIKAQISGKAKSYGNMSYDPKEKKLTVKITEVKFTFLDVTSRVFTELKKKESDKMKVNRPYVYLSLK